MSEKVVFEGELIHAGNEYYGVALGFRHHTLSLDACVPIGDRVRVTIERLPEPEPEPRCPNCGGEVREGDYVHEAGHVLTIEHLANCRQCLAWGKAPTRQAALDALAEWLKPCPRCGVVVGYCSLGLNPETMKWKVSCGCSIHSPWFSTKRAARGWWNERKA